MSLLTGQKSVSPQRGMPTDDVGHSSTIVSVSAETVQLYYYHATTHVLTTDAGQAAGVVVVGQLVYENIQNALGTMMGCKKDSSLSFTAGVLTTEKELDPSILESVDASDGYKRADALTEGLSNGEYVVDYANGTIYGLKTTTGTTLADAAYKIKQGVVASAATVTPNVNVKQINGVTPLMGNGVTGTGSPRVTIASDNTKIPTYNIASLVTVAYDYVGVTWTVGTFTEVFAFKTGGSGGSTVATVTVVYVDATKEQLVSVASS